MRTRRAPEKDRSLRPTLSAQHQSVPHQRDTSGRHLRVQPRPSQPCSPPDGPSHAIGHREIKHTADSTGRAAAFEQLGPFSAPSSPWRRTAPYPTQVTRRSAESPAVKPPAQIASGLGCVGRDHPSAVNAFAGHRCLSVDRVRAMWTGACPNSVEEGPKGGRVLDRVVAASTALPLSIRRLSRRR